MSGRQIGVVLTEAEVLALMAAARLVLTNDAVDEENLATFTLSRAIMKLDAALTKD